MESQDPVNVRIITTLGHVDHGKTTLMDSLLASNNIISSRMAGKMRYMDSREDEQERGITMESSAVSLRFFVTGQDDGEPRQKCYVVNIIDTPGHVDFSSEVSTASQLCDGALVLVDVVEGVCTQTISVLRQSWIDGLRPILVLNKMDRLVTELKLGPLEAYNHLSRLVEQVNAVMGGFFAGERMEEDLRWREQLERQQADLDGVEHDPAFNETFQEKDDEDIYFAPQRGNVIFASAIDNWGFRVSKFAQIYAVKLGVKEANLRRVLWGDYYLDPKSKKVIGNKHLRGRALKPMFVQFVLDNIWAIYDAVIIKSNPEKVSKIVTALGLKIPPRDLKSKDSRYLLTLIFSQWLPLSSCVAQTVIDVVPPPSIAQMIRLPKMLNLDLQNPNNSTESAAAMSVLSGVGSESCLLAYVSKMFAVPEKFFLEKSKRRTTTPYKDRMADTAQKTPREEVIPALSSMVDLDQADGVKEDAEVLLGFARLYSGTIRIGNRIHCVLPKYQNALSPDHPSNLQHVITATVTGLYMMMGRELLPFDSIQAGNIFAIRGLESKVWRSATLCGSGDDSTRLQAPLVNLGRVTHSVPPIVRVALEPVVPADMPKLISGLKLLSQSDPCVETFQQATGEHVILTAGELHLERCLKDLRERFAKIEIQASKPIVPFRETAIKAADMPPPKTPQAVRGTVRGSSAHDIVTFTIRACPLPKPLSTFLRLHSRCLRKLLQESGIGGDEDDVLHQEFDSNGDIVQDAITDSDRFWAALRDVCEGVGGEWRSTVDRIMCFGPHMVGGCVLIDFRDGATTSGSTYGLKARLAQAQRDIASHPETHTLSMHHIETGFQLAVAHGPLCAEPMEGMAFFVESLEIATEGLQKEITQGRVGHVTGSLISAVRDACKNGMLDWSPRLMLAMYTCDIQASADVLGRVYAVVTKRRGRIVAEEMKEGTMLFNVRAMLPVVESFGFADDIRTRTSGAASPQLIFSGYELLDQDPFWVPTTEEELEDLGEKSDRSNIAKGYLDGVRERKGMFLDRKLIENAEKQRTLKK